MSKFMQYAMAACAEALNDSGWLPNTNDEQEMTVSGVTSATNKLPQLTKHRGYA